MAQSPVDDRGAAAGGRVPPGLVVAAGWTWRALLLLVAAWAALQVAKRLYLLTLAFAAGILLAALGLPLVTLLRRHRVPRSLAVAATALAALAVVGGLGFWIGSRAAAQAPTLAVDLADVAGRLPLGGSGLGGLRDRLTSALGQNLTKISQPVLSGLTTVGEFATGSILAVFVGVYLLHGGDRVWGWATSLLPRPQRLVVRSVGPSMWRALSGWIRGTALIAVFHGVVIGTVLAVIGVPLALPLAVLVFLGSFVPIAGAVLFGGLAVLVALASKGLLLAVVVLAVLVVENQVESHLLQPFLVGRYVRLNALAVVCALTAGSLLWGVAGAVLAVPLTGAVHAALTAWHQRDGAPDDADDHREPGRARGHPGAAAPS